MWFCIWVSWSSSVKSEYHTYLGEYTQSGMSNIDYTVRRSLKFYYYHSTFFSSVEEKITWGCTLFSPECKLFTWGSDLIVCPGWAAQNSLNVPVDFAPYPSSTHILGCSQGASPSSCWHTCSFPTDRTLFSSGAWFFRGDVPGPGRISSGQ